MKYYKRLFRYAFRFPVLLSLSIATALMVVVTKVGAAFQAGNFFSDTFIGNNFDAVTLWKVLVLVILGFLWALFHYFVFVSSNSLAVSVMHDLRRDVFNKLLDLPLGFYKKNRTGEILSRVLNDIGVIETFFMNIMVDLIAQPLTLVVIVVIMFFMNPRISLYFFAIGPVIALVLGGIGALVQKLAMSVQKNISDVTSNIQETIYGIEVIKGFAAEDTMKDRYQGANDRHLKSIKKEIKVRFLGIPSSEFLGVLAVIVILALGAVSVRSGVATSQDIVNFIILALVLSEPLSKTSDMFMVLKKLGPAAERIFEILDAEDHEAQGKPDFGPIRGRISFDHLSFGYQPDQLVLHDIELTIEPGETVAIVGPSGAGKSSLVSMVPVFYPPTEGRFLIDGKDVQDYDPKSIRSQIAIVTQENLLFSGTVLENIRMSKPEATLEEVYDAAEKAHAHGFITAFPQGYDTELGDKGARLSGGERQRIALARAILRQPRIFILDEATSALDAESEKQVQAAFDDILGKQTTLVIAHKLSTIANADRIIVVDGGRIIEQGSHQELLEQKGIYQKLFQIQVQV